MAATDSDVKECWYVVLGVERTATPDEIRSAYRKEALKWHPDKIQQSGATPAECQEATIRFQKLAQAYEVLSDPVERAWYDKYRSEILSSGTASRDFEFNVFSFFSPSAFSGFGDTKKGFYNVYSDVFAKIHQKEQAFAKAYGVGPIGEAPGIGNLSSPISEVEEFYKYWTGFSSMKDFSWCDEYQVSQAPNRKIRRLMEEENAKIRKRSKREYNDAVRDLATFVKKRDKRWLDHKLEQQRLQKEKEQQLKAKQLKIQQEKVAKARAFQEQEWMKTPADALDDEDDANHDVNEGSYDWKGGGKKKLAGEEDTQEFFCIICNKRFRSEKQWKNHEKSKKHIERASVLRASFLEDDKVVEAASSSADLEDSAGSSAENLNDAENGGLEGREQEDSAGSEENGGGRTRKSTGRPHRSVENQTDANRDSSEDDSEGIHEGDEDELLAEMMSRMAGPQTDVRSSTRNEDAELPEEDSMHRVADGSSSELDDGNADTTYVPYSEKDDEDNISSMLKSRRKQVRFASDVKDDEEKTESSHQNEENKDRASSGRGSRKKKSNSEKQRKAAAGRYDNLQSELSSSPLENPSGTEVVSSDVDTEEPPVGEYQKSQPAPVKRKAQRGQKKSKNKGGVNHSANKCDTCGEDFDSRTQLFRHLSVTNHATLKSH